MKKLLSLISSISLLGTSVLTSTQVVSCDGKWSQLYKSILEKDMQTLSGKSYYDTGSEKICLSGNKDCTDKEEKKWVSLSLNHEIKEEELKKITDESLELFEEASTYFGTIVPPYNPEDKTGNKWYNSIEEDIKAKGKSSNQMDDAQRNVFLDVLGDQIVKPEFEANTVRFAVSRNNLKYIQYYYDNFLVKNAGTEEEYKQKVEKMNTYLKNGYFIPMFKIVNEGKAISHGTSLTKIKFNDTLVEYIKSKIDEDAVLKKYKDYWFKNQDEIYDAKSGLISKDKVDGKKIALAKDVSVIMDLENVSRFYEYGFTKIGGEK